MVALHLASSQADGFAESVSQSQQEMVTQEIASAIGVGFVDVQPSCALVADLGASLSDLLILRTGLEVTFNLYVPREHLHAWRTVADVQTYVQQRLTDRRG
jgi:acyl carrier protein